MTIARMVQVLYNIVQSQKKSHEATNTFEKRNICKKTAKAITWEAATFFVMGFVCLIFKK
jgi:delta-aminolevulinic acid dehydratase/porphobilinogen synthase